MLLLNPTPSMVSNSLPKRWLTCGDTLCTSAHNKGATTCHVVVQCLVIVQPVYMHVRAYTIHSYVCTCTHIMHSAVLLCFWDVIHSHHTWEYFKHDQFTRRSEVVGVAVLPCVANTHNQHGHVVESRRGFNSALDPGAVVPHIAGVGLIGGWIRGAAQPIARSKLYSFNVKWI